MKYPAIFKKEKDGKFGVCVSCGDNYKHAVEMAKEALKLHVEGLLKDGKKLPKPSLAGFIVFENL